MTSSYEPPEILGSEGHEGFDINRYTLFLGSLLGASEGPSKYVMNKDSLDYYYLNPKSRKIIVQNP